MSDLVKTGLQEILKLIADQGVPYEAINGYLGVGNDNTPTDFAMTDLQGTKARTLVDGNPSLDLDLLTTQWVATFPVEVGNFEWLEVGIFNHPSAGSMLTRTVPPVSLGVKDNTVRVLRYTVTWEECDVEES